jgi:GNAT superfamily N-acetyltransferase
MNASMIRTSTSHPDFMLLIQLLDHELWNELNEDQATYDQYNKVPDLETAVIVYIDNTPAACGCFKEFAKDTIEIKRMYVQKAFRGKGLSKKVLHELEAWGRERNYQNAVLETSIHFNVAQQLYNSNGYTTITNYPPYEELSESICMGKAL